MEKIKIYFEKLLSFLRIHVHADGLEISDQVLRFVYTHRGVWHMEAVRLAPGILEKGAIKDAAAFAEALRELRMKTLFAKLKGKKINVFIALSSVNMYSQVFTLPIMEGEEFSKAIDLNVQMASPMDISHSYFSWQIMGRDETKLRSEVAAAFADKKIVDAMAQALYAAGFVAVGVESRALALVRAVREEGAGLDLGAPYLLVDVDNSGMDFIIIRKGKFYFEYPNFWGDIADEKGQISTEKFSEMITASTRQVLNFYSQHWPEPLAGVAISAAGFEAPLTQAIKEATALPIVELALQDASAVPPEWFVALGCAVRGLRAGQREDKEINLSGGGAMELFQEERMMDFLSLWRVLIPTILACLIVVLFLSSLFLGMTKSNIESSAAFAEGQGGAGNYAALEASSTAFNQSVALVAGAEQQVSGSYQMIAEIQNVATANGVTISHISFQSMTTPILVAGAAPSETQIAAFRDAIQSDPHFGTVNLPLLNIQQSGGVYTFSMSFPLSATGF